MDPALILDNILTPPILFFVLGVVATLVRSDLEVPAQVARFLSLYLLFSIGLHGGHELARSELEASSVLILILAVLTSMLIPVWMFFLLRRRISGADAAAIGATYGSVSAVTFITAVGFLNAVDVPFGGHMVAAMALMESPAIVVGVLLARRFDDRPDREPFRWSELGREAFLNGSVLVLLGSLIVGLVSGDAGWESVKPFAYDPFKGVLCLFLLDMGLVAARRLRDLRNSGALLVTVAIVGPILHGFLGIAIARLVGVSEGDALLVAMLVGGGSYIAVPAAVRLAIPEANPSLYVPMALGVTFPFNVIVGIPMHFAIIQWLWSAG
ncbi:MAG: sodium-dependent bicarbonate transport family permease [Phycisphaerales bacterium]